MATAPRRVAGVLLALLLPLLYVVTAAGSAQAADGFKYWNYFHVQGAKYAFAQTGPADFTPKDGTVEAYRYGLSSTAAGLPPRTDATTYTFDDLCQDSKAKAGEKRVGVLLDYGTAADAASGETPPDPRGACAVVPTAANGQQVLDEVTDLRVQGGLVCGIDGYPAKGCSITVKNPPAQQTEQSVDFTLPASAADTRAASSTDDDGGVSWPLVGVAAAVVVLGGGALLLARRNRSA
ncbi:MAG: hypothetical protein HOQ22_14600 [Nocardioidaceae bacterium]|nr:hypothetical protein [Nocardioidaceae bacterium]NUS52255.1 hypothetical protein [Nocardioidaceae bacterium]